MMEVKVGKKKNDGDLRSWQVVCRVVVANESGH